jgi:hypothetical protein
MCFTVLSVSWSCCNLSSAPTTGWPLQRAHDLRIADHRLDVQREALS